MDKKQLKLNSDKTEYILLGSNQQLNKAAYEPFKARQGRFHGTE